MSESTPHLSFEMIAEMALREVESPAGIAHVASCSLCSIEKESVERLIDAMRMDRMEDAPRYAVTSILRAFDERKPSTAEHKPTLVERLTAILQFDSLNLGPAQGFRSGHGSAARQMLLSAGDLTFDLRLKSVDGNIDITGQVLGDADSGFIFLENESENRSASVGPDGEFHIDAVPAGVYRFIFRGDSVEAEFAALEIG